MNKLHSQKTKADENIEIETVIAKQAEVESTNNYKNIMDTLDDDISLLKKPITQNKKSIKKTVTSFLCTMLMISMLITLIAYYNRSSSLSSLNLQLQKENFRMQEENRKIVKVNRNIFYENQILKKTYNKIMKRKNELEISLKEYELKEEIKPQKVEQSDNNIKKNQESNQVSFEFSEKLNSQNLKKEALERSQNKILEKKHLKRCDSVVGYSVPNIKGWYSLLGGVMCGVSRAHSRNETFTIRLENSIYTDKKVNAFDLPYQPIGNCKITKKTKTYSMAGWHCPEPQTRKELAFLIDKYIKPRENVQKIIDTFVDQNFGKHTLGIHIRATDRGVDNYLKRKNVYKISSARIIKSIERYILENPQTDKIFVASDNTKQLNDIIEKFPNLVVFQNARRSKGNARVHTQHDGYAKIIEVVVDARLLARTKYLIKCYSEVSLMTLVINPLLNFDLLNVPDKGFQYEDFKIEISGFQKNKYIKMSDINL